MRFLQHNQQSQEIERKKLKKLTLILTCLAVVFAVRALRRIVWRARDKLNYSAPQVSSLPLNIFFTLTDLGLIFISDVQVGYSELCKNKNGQSVVHCSVFFSQCRNSSNENGEHCSCSVQVYCFTLGLCHLISMSSCVSNPILYGWLQA